MNQIEWWDEGWRNARLYRHRGCNGGNMQWLVPLDDCPPPTDGDRECARCCCVLPLVARFVDREVLRGDEAVDMALEAWSAAQGFSWPGQRDAMLNALIAALGEQPQ